MAMASHRTIVRVCLIHHPERRDLALPNTAVRRAPSAPPLTKASVKERSILMDRPQYYRFHQGQKQLPFTEAEYDHV